MPKVGAPVKKPVVKKSSAALPRPVANLCKACGGIGKNSRGKTCICKIRLKQLALPFK